MACAADPEDLLSLSNVNPLGLRWKVNDYVDYVAACARCEIVVEIDARQHRLLKGRRLRQLRRQLHSIF